MATANNSSRKLSIVHRGAKLQFGIHKPTGQFRKKYRGQTLYLGSDPDGVLDQWLSKTSQVDDELEGVVEVSAAELSVSNLCNLFLASKLSEVESGELSPATYRGYKEYARQVIAFFGRSTPIADLKPSDFAALRKDFQNPKPQRIAGKKTKRARVAKISLESLKTKIRHVRVIFNFAVEEGYLPSVPWTKATFSLPKQKAITKQRNGKPPKQATRDELKAVLAECDDTWTALVLYALNSGSGNTDCGMLKWDDIDADGWVETPRNKTQRERRFKLWPETRAAIEKLRERHALKGYDDGLVFHGRQGGTYIPKGKTNHVSRRFTELTIKAGVNRENLSFYSLRHTFQNVADEAGDFVATSYVMGHSGTSISDRYRGTPSDERLERVTESVRQWLFGSEVAK